MRFARFLTLFALLALLAAPFGRIGAAEASAMPGHGAAGAGHCEGMPMPEPASGDERGAIDCMIACAAIAAADAPALDSVQAAPGVEAHRAPAAFAGLSPESEPPPPRFS